MSSVHIGTSGWKYPEWRRRFYPPGLRQVDELEYLAQQMNSAEINGSFYSLQTPQRYANWAAQTPDGFVFAVKGSRYVTHIKRLAEPEQTLANFYASGPLALGSRTGPFLWQMARNTVFHADRIAQFLAALPTTATAAAALAATSERVEEPYTQAPVPGPLRHAMEVRHESFRDPAFLTLLREHNVALVCADSAGRFPYFEDVTADFTYVRLHGPKRLYYGSYQPDLITEWATRIRGWIDTGLDTYVYFDNTAGGSAPHDAVALEELLSGG